MLVRRYAQILGSLAAVATLGACAHKQQVGQIDLRDARNSTQWNGILSTPGDMSGATDIHGTVSLAGNGPGRSVATVIIRNAAPSGVHPWEVYQGPCGTDGDILGAFSSYPPLTVRDNGTAHASAKLQAELPVTGEYHVNVNASSTNMQNIVACANLAAPSGA